MNLFVADAEFETASTQLNDAIDDLTTIGMQFLAKLEKLKNMGYQSDDMNAAITQYQEVVRSSLNLFASTSEPVTQDIASFIKIVDELDNL